MDSLIVIFIIWVIFPYLFLKPIKKRILNSMQSRYEQKMELSDMLCPAFNWIIFIKYNLFYLGHFLDAVHRFLTPFAGIFVSVYRRIEKFVIEYEDINNHQ
jgi:hypothetical protein